MIQITVSDSFFQYDAFHLTKAFYPNEVIHNTVVNVEEKQDNETYEHLEHVVLTFSLDNVEKFHILEDACGKLPEKEDKIGRKSCKHAVNMELYRGLQELSGKSLEWGILTGVRPTKIAMKKWNEFRELNANIENTEENLIEEQVVEWMQSYYGVSESKASLAMEIAHREDQLIQGLDLVEGFSLYIGIPFCRTRCSYCSFTAYPFHEWEHRIDEYLDALCKEIEFVGRMASPSYGNKKLNTIYIGGGTPTTLSAKQLDRLLTCVETHFSYEHLQEITVEAGRPDTITREKLEVMKHHNIGRISINPQTMQDKTLKLIGREHSVQDIYDVYQVAKELGFENINMDLIVGLPEETLEDVEDTLEAISKLAPDSITVHALAMKRASKMTMSGEGVKEVYQMDEMIDLAAKYAKKMDLEPYYLYRQKNMVGNYENVGYAKVDKAGIYNILIMEEKQSIVALGAGASTKIILPREHDNIIRTENVKDVNEYITRIDEMIERKGEWLWH